jgi:hypothetical protein
VFFWRFFWLLNSLQKEVIMIVAFITWNSNLVRLIESPCSSNLYRFVFSVSGGVLVLKNSMPIYTIIHLGVVISEIWKTFSQTCWLRVALQPTATHCNPLQLGQDHRHEVPQGLQNQGQRQKVPYPE